MKISSFEAMILNVPETDPLANMPEEEGRTRPVIALRRRTDDGLEGIAVTLYGAKMTGSLHRVVEGFDTAQLALMKGPCPMQKLCSAVVLARPVR